MNQKKLNLPWQSIGHLLRDRSREIGDKPGIVFEGRSCTFADLESRSNQLANVLTSLGIRHGDKVAVILPNGFEFPIAWLALAKIGAIMVPVNTQYRSNELLFVLTHSDASLAIAGPGQVDSLMDVQPECPLLKQIEVFGGNGSEDLANQMTAADQLFAVDHIQQSDLINLQFTSGTTGFPKACMLPQKYWLKLGADMADYIQPQSGDAHLTAQPFYYMDPQWNLILCLIAGIPLVILPRFSASTFWQAVYENKVTFFYCLGAMPVFLLKQPERPQFEKNHRVRLVIVSGLPVQLHEAVETRWGAPWREGYGTTETGGDMLVAVDDVSSVGTGSLGTPVPGKEIKIVDEHGQPVKAGEVGELVIRGESTMIGYYKDPEATAEKIRDGWLHTGDLFRQDSAGNNYIVGRIKDMVRRSGENIASAEVEGVLNSHPAVLLSAVIPVPDPERGEEVKAFVQLHPDVEQVHPKELLDFAADRLAKFKLPRYLEFTDGFTFTPSERIVKRELLARKVDQRQGAYDATIGQWR
ncbi:MAG: ATP-dependent acyl-CoA ligase [Gammaproteobacteria bacterium]|nr:ATP-dependent acyl-CoA ligase [Gammaproteobacteria bacterium]